MTTMVRGGAGSACEVIAAAAVKIQNAIEYFMSFPLQPMVGTQGHGGLR
jgi:hypothetical protein